MIEQVFWNERWQRLYSRRDYLAGTHVTTTYVKHGKTRSGWEILDAQDRKGLIERGHWRMIEDERRAA